ncbi:hypothetical protein [Leifsonia sp. 71-9]|uniref:hypothetical protein n=1 Tax=Leifsonia sp. 71-9 TaxID=1895934 RepID=UPI00092C5710|nr:hypothetical protein [Leifsonia sp. 71-9]OJX72196.1 MAG: hypothetical protein BGO91_10975 [Leifsonia sp. 71-9]
MSSHSSDDASAPTPAEKGCGWCRGFYYAWSNDAPDVVAAFEDGVLTLRRCRHCGSYWLENAFSFPEQIDDERARRLIEEER